MTGRGLFCSGPSRSPETAQPDHALQGRGHHFPLSVFMESEPANQRLRPVVVMICAGNKAGVGSSVQQLINHSANRPLHDPPPPMRPGQPEADFTVTGNICRVADKTASHPVMKTQREGKTSCRILHGRLDIRMFVPPQKLVSMIQLIGIGHPRQPARDSPVIQAGDKILAVRSAERAKRDMVIEEELHRRRMKLVTCKGKSQSHQAMLLCRTYQKAAVTGPVTAA